MKITHLENGDIVVTQGNKPIHVVLGIATFLYFAKDIFLPVFVVEEINGSWLLGFAVITLTILFFYRVFSLRSTFKFSHTDKNLNYMVQYPFSNKRGAISLESIEEVILQTDSEGASRIILKLEKNEIPMSSAVKYLGSHDTVVTEINEWLSENSSQLS